MVKEKKGFKIGGRNFWLGTAIFLIALAAVSVFFFKDSLCGTEKGFVMEEDQVEERVMKYIKDNVGSASVTIGEMKEEGGLYVFDLDIEGQNYQSFATKDGKYLFPQAIDLEEFADSSETSQRETPDVKLFVMSYCPYGLQAQKGFLPVWELLGDKADMGIYFVDYIMHDKEEIDENMVQYCIENEQPEKIISYLECFVDKGEGDVCLEEAGVDRESLNDCVSRTDEEYGATAAYENKESWINGQYPVFEVHADLNEEYDVSGSPTLVINDQVVSLPDRSPESFKNRICEAFTEKPEECSQTLSTQALSPGFGMEAGAASGGSCE